MRVLDRATPERLSMFSDGVFAVLITVLVLDLHPPELPTFKALMSLWPTWLSYAVSYLFIAIVWTNHHYLMRYATEANPSSPVVQFRPSVFHVAASALHSLDGREPTGTAAGCLLCGSFLPRKRNLYRLDLGAYWHR
jgi:Endosomal/lysosomal potassium channel TMEM175